ncbi:cyclase family protein [Nocardioides sp.]|uniref:cyclase family protein n=1 Tax=Nocardioides sp. TaxID=35761 RepID=UPI003782D7E9
MTPEQLRDLGAAISNWGRWGADDEIGTLNHVTEERILAAAALVRRGRVFDLGMPLDAHGPQPGGVRFNPIHRMSVTPSDYANSADGMVAADDMVMMTLQAATQWDSLAHVGYDDRLYNDVPASAVNSFGASRNAIDKTVGRMVGRGVLLDIARLKEVDSLASGERIEAEDLEAAERRQGVTVGAGDFLFVRTGWYQTFLGGDSAAYLGPSPGLALSCCEWLHRRDVAAVCADNSAVEVLPSEIEGVDVPLHMVLIRDLGLTLGEMFNLEELAADCAETGVSEFFFSGSALKFTGAVGSPLSPLAIT